MGCISFRTAVSPHLRGWSWEDELTLDTSTLWAKPKFDESYHQRISPIILASENCLSFWSCASFWATWYLVVCQWKGWGRWELLVQWAGLCLLLLCSRGGKRPWTQWLASNTVMANIWHRNAGWVLQCGEERWGGLLRWTGPLISLFPVKLFWEPHSLILPPKNVRGQSRQVPSAILPQPPRRSHRLELEKCIKPQMLRLFAHWLYWEQNEGNPLHFLSTRLQGKSYLSPSLCQSKQKISDQKELDTNGVWHIFFKARRKNHI